MRLYRFYFDCGRMGALEGIFVVNAQGEECLRALIASRREVCFGEVLGKHSDVCGPINAGDVVPVEATRADIETVCRVFGVSLPADAAGLPWGTISGFNPLETAAEQAETRTGADLLAWCSA